jgi:porphobilinogen synthase
MLGPERLRALPSLRSMLRETEVDRRHLVLPVFLNDQKKGSKDIGSMPGVSQWSVQASLKFVEEAAKNGLGSLIVFGVVEGAHKDGKGSAAWDPKGPVCQALELYKKHFPELTLIADLCFCEYTDHGHCGTFKKSKSGAFVRDHRDTISSLKKAAIAYAESGADIIAPSGMIDGQISAIREALDAKDFERTAICSYAVKYASSFYGPFREAAENAPLKGTDRKSYQMDPANSLEALREARLDVEQGADMLLVKPGLPYLDVLSDVASSFDVPVGAYQVSGEYSLIKAAGEKGYVNEEAVFWESLISLRRAGARFILSYWALEAAKLMAAGRGP